MLARALRAIVQQQLKKKLEEKPDEREQAEKRRQEEARKYVSAPSILAAVVVWIVGGAAGAVTVTTALVPGIGILVASLLLGLYLLFAIKIANQWEKAVVLRFGKYRGLSGPGLFWVVPVVDQVAHFVDQRVRATDVTAESALTRDTVPVNVDAIVFWLVWDAEKSILEVESFWSAIFLSAQTALREAIGRHDLAEMITEREKLGRELQRILDEKTNPWGITVQSVEIRDVKIPPDLEDAMSRQAQAERERQARIILGTAETEIAGKFAAAAEVYQGNPVAMHLRAMNMLYEAIKEKGSMVIVPSSAVETMGLGAMTGLASLGGAKVGE
jgi:SPFH domain/Band 7 family protein